MADRQFRPVLEGGSYFEGPRWHDGRTLLLCCAPDFYEDTRAPVREAVLVSTDVDVPHAGLP